jgi:hypothetical protein
VRVTNGNLDTGSFKVDFHDLDMADNQSTTPNWGYFYGLQRCIEAENAPQQRIMLFNQSFCELKLGSCDFKKLKPTCAEGVDGCMKVSASGLGKAVDGAMGKGFREL